MVHTVLLIPPPPNKKYLLNFKPTIKRLVTGRNRKFYTIFFPFCYKHIQKSVGLLFLTVKTLKVLSITDPLPTSSFKKCKKKKHATYDN